MWLNLCLFQLIRCIKQPVLLQRSSDDTWAYLWADLTVGIYFLTVREATCRFSLCNNTSSSLHQHLIQTIETKYLIYDSSQTLAQNINSIFLLSRIQWSHIFFPGVDWAGKMEHQCESKPPEKNNPIYPTMHLFTFPASLWTAGSVWSLIGFSAVSCPPDEGF